MICCVWVGTPLVSVPQWDCPFVHGDCLPSLFYMCQVEDVFIQILWQSIGLSSHACVAATLTLYVC